MAKALTVRYRLPHRLSKLGDDGIGGLHSSSGRGAVLTGDG